MKIRTKDNVLEDEECLQIIKKRLLRDKMEDYALVKYELLPIDGSAGFMGQYFTLKATVTSPKSSDTKNIHFFAKIPPPQNSPQWEFNLEHGSFKKEVDLYTEVFPELLRGLDQCSIPECFFAFGADVIVLEDMFPEGYTMISKHVPFDLDHCRVVMKTLAKFHAKSLIFEEIYKKNLHDEFAHCMHETLFPDKEEGRGKRAFTAAVRGVVSMIDLLDALDDASKIKFKETLIALSQNHVKKLLPSKRFKNVLCHGDLWANNILFKYGDAGRPDACCLIDFQLARYNPPAHDVLCFFQFSTTRELREKHGQELFKIYHDSLSSTLIQAGLDPSIVFPFEEFLDSIEEMKTFSMVHGILNTPIMLLESQAVSKYFDEDPGSLEHLLFDDRTPLVCGQFNEVERYRERMVDSLLELHDRLKAV